MGDTKRDFAYASPMTVLRHFLVGLLALALMVGTGWQSCVTLQLKQQPASEHAGSIQSHDQHQHAIAHAEAVHIEAAIKDKATGSDHACLKCCAACMMPSAVPLALEWTVVPAVSRVIFASLSEQVSGQVVFVDPDIPKQIV